MLFSGKKENKWKFYFPCTCLILSMWHLINLSNFTIRTKLVWVAKKPPNTPQNPNQMTRYLIQNQAITTSWIYLVQLCMCIFSFPEETIGNPLNVTGCPIPSREIFCLFWRAALPLCPGPSCSGWPHDSCIGTKIAQILYCPLLPRKVKHAPHPSFLVTDSFRWGEKIKLK